MSEQSSATQSIKKEITGVVVSNKMSKTIVVQIERKEKHPLYGKYVRRFSKRYVHDEHNAARIGDLVKIVNSRPLSKLKRWNLVDVIKRKDQE